MAVEITTELARIRHEFREQIEAVLDKRGMSRADLARVAGLSESRIAQILDGKGSMRLLTVVKIVRALHLKCSAVAYDGPKPVSAQVIATCWEKQGQPRDMFEASATRPRRA